MIVKKSLTAEKSAEFSLSVIKLYNFLQKEKKEFVMSKQILKSGTSIGANVAEAKYAQSNLDFISKLSIALKEASETEYWLDLLEKSGYVTEEQTIEMKSECVSIIKMLTASINTMKNKIK